MEHKVRVWIRWIVFIVCVCAIIYFQRTVGKQELMYMLLALVGILAVLYDYNRDYTHPRRDK
ncbi:MAG: hypothetical protein Q4B80_05035 [Aerococcaceae bacterium]|nr:hypothetical protein [Aerococcaceae bacterium]